MSTSPLKPYMYADSAGVRASELTDCQEVLARATLAYASPKHRIV